MEFTGKRRGTKGAQHASLYCCLLTLPTSGTMPLFLTFAGGFNLFPAEVPGNEACLGWASPWAFKFM